MTRDSRSVVSIGLPASGKTTYLAALWYLVTRTGGTRLQFNGLLEGDNSHLNNTAERWSEARTQDRTKMRGDLVVKLSLHDSDGRAIVLGFPDVAGEAFKEMWANRECDPIVSEMIRDGNVLLFIHADNIVQPAPLMPLPSSSAAGEEPPAEGIPWSPDISPTQVMLVSLLSMLNEPALGGPPRSTRRLAIMLSAWDIVESRGKSPEEFLREHLPLLYQYLQLGSDGWISRIYGVSAQGGTYDNPDMETPGDDASRLLSFDSPIDRIRLVRGTETSKDLTEPLEWLIG
jgi:hypothetical protein